MRIGYGLTDDIATFQGLTPSTIGQRLIDLGCDGVFLKQLDPTWAKVLRASGLQVFVSFGVFLENENLWQRFAHSRPVTAHGTPAPQQGWYRPLLPTDPTIRQLRLQQIETLVEQLPIDGLWLDFMRWPARWEQPEPQLYDSSFDAATLTQFQNDTMNLIPPAIAADPAKAARWIFENMADSWLAWRCEQIRSFVAEAKAILQKHQPHALLGLFTVPWLAGVADQTGYDNAHCRIVGQDPLLLSQHVDILSPMCYHRLCGRDPKWVGDVTAGLHQLLKSADNQTEVWPIIEVLNEPTTYPITEFEQVCQAAKTAPDAGLIVFKLAGMLLDPARFRAW